MFWRLVNAKRKASGLGMCFYIVDLSCPTIADDMLVEYYPKAGLEGLINICLKYSYS